MTFELKRPRYLSREQAADYLGVSVPTMARWASKGQGPTYYRLGRHARYLQKDLDAYIETRRKMG